MKIRITFLLIITLFSIELRAQFESIFGQDETEWSITRGFFLGIIQDKGLIQGDTLINGFEYKKGQWLVNEPLPEMEPNFYLRENSIDGRAWVRIEEEEWLFMDLSLEVGDSFLIDHGNWVVEPGYYFVDSVYFFDNRKHVRLNYPLYWLEEEKLTFIEGVGTNSGYIHYASNLNPYLLCTKKNDTLAYQNNSLEHRNDCELLTQTFTHPTNIWTHHASTLSDAFVPEYHYIDGDTIVNGMTYAKIYFYADYGNDFYTDTTYLGGVREADEQVWYLPASVPDECLIFDWNANIGDTIQTLANNYYVLSTIDTITLLNNEQRRHYHTDRYRLNNDGSIDTAMQALSYIEGIGIYDSGLAFNEPKCEEFNFFSTAVALRCFSQDGTLLWMNPAFPACDDIISDVVEISQSPTFSLYPNPVQDVLQIEFHSDIRWEDVLVVYNLQGQEVGKPLLTARQVGLEINMQHLTDGIYLIGLYRDGQLLQQQKILKQ